MPATIFLQTDTTSILADLGNATKLIIQKLEVWLEQIFFMLPNFILAILLMFLFIMLARLVNKLIFKILSRFSHHTAVNRLISTITYIIVIFVGIFIALGLLNLDKTVTSLLAGAGIIGLALSFAFQDTAANFIAGVILAIRQPIEVGEVVKTNDFYGTVTRINLRTLRLRTPEGYVVIIPNKDVLQKPIINYSTSGERRIDLEVGISYGEDLEKVRDITLEAIKKIEYLLPHQPVEVFYTEFGDSSIDFVARYWVNFKRPLDFVRATSDGIMNIKKAFDQNGITIPFPIRTLDFGIKGGEKLNDVLKDYKKIQN